MKIFLILVAACAAIWYGMKRLHETSAAQQIVGAPVAYTKSLQEDVSRAQKAAEAAAAANRRVVEETQKAVEVAP